jgi:hypothetical protein
MAVNGDIWRLVPLVVAMAYASPTAADDRAASLAADRDPSIHGAFNNGEDFTRPLNRFDLRGRYERLPDEGGLDPEKWVTTLRTDLWTGIGKGWKLYGRVDVHLLDVAAGYAFNHGVAYWVGEATAEGYARDATTGTLLWEGADERAGTKALGRDTFNSWDDVDNAFKAWAEQFARRLDELGACPR